jgi:phage shock protein C
MEKRLYRDELNKKIAGVCAGLAEYLNIDVTIVRVVFALALILKGVGVLPYIVLWVVLPKKPYHLGNPSVDYTVPPQTDGYNPFSAGVPPTPPFAMERKKTSSFGLIAGMALVLFGSFFLLEEFNLVPFLDFEKLWPVIFIIVGAVIIFSGRDKTPKPVEEKWEAAEKTDAFKATTNDDVNNTTSQL